MNKLFWGVLAVGLVALFAGTMVSAVDVSAILHSGVFVNGNADGKALLGQRMLSSMEKGAGKSIQKIEARESLKASLAEDFESSTKEQVRSFKDSVKVLKKAVLEFKQKVKNQDKGILGEFRNWPVKRIINASGLSSEQKSMLLSEYEKTISRATDNTATWNRHSFLLWNTDKPFVAIGKLSQVSGGSSSLALARGFSSLGEHRFFMVMANGVLVGVQKEEVFWGTYANGKVSLTFKNGGTIDAQYKIYD